MVAQPSLFDTHKLFKSYMNVGFTEEQAETLLTEQKEIVDNNSLSRDNIIPSFFDPQKTIKRLIKAGFTEKQAQELANMKQAVIENNLAVKEHTKNA